MGPVVPLIVKDDPVTLLELGKHSRSPNVAVVYVTADGHVEVLDRGRPLRFAESTLRYKRRFEVDLSDHHRTVELRSSPPPALGGIYHFDAKVNIGFRVTKPEEVVRRNIRDGLQVVCDHLMWVMRGITSRVPIEEAKAAEDAVNARLAQPELIEGCIELYLCRARLEPDGAARAYLQAEQRARRTNVVKTAEHETNVSDANRSAELGFIQQSSRLTQQAREHHALAGRPMSMQDMVALHLERHPGDTAGAMALLAQMQSDVNRRADEAAAANRDMFKFMAQHDLVLPSDAQQMRDQVMPPPVHHALPSAVPAQATAGWDDPVPAPGGAKSALPGLVPVYVVLDSSYAIGAGAGSLNRALQAMYTGLAADPQVASVLRVAVLAYADDVTVLQPAREPLADLRLPYLDGGSGQARLTPLFEHLASTVPHDAAAFKAEVPALRRPQVLLLCAGPAADAQTWPGAHAELTDRARQRYAPDIIACGVGAAGPQLLHELATRPELAFAGADADLAGGVERFCEFARHRITDLARAVLDGDPTVEVRGPRGFRPAGAAHTSHAATDGT